MLRLHRSWRKSLEIIKLGALGSQILEKHFCSATAHNPSTDEIYEKIAQMRTELGLVLKHVIGGAEKVNVVNYLFKPPPPTDEEDSDAINDHKGGFQPNAQGSNKENWRQGEGNPGQNYSNYN